MTRKRADGAKAAAKGHVPEAKADEVTPHGASIIADLEGLVETLTAGAPLEQRDTVRRARFDFGPRHYAPADVRRVRDLMGMSQAVFASFLGVDAATVRSWEQGQRVPSGMARRFLAEIEDDVEHWKGKVRASLRSEEVQPRREGS